MRLWSLHPCYLDPRGLVALWREALLAQQVLKGNTRGYRNHPQLTRFRQHPAPSAAISTYLQAVLDESRLRRYSFDGRKISPERTSHRIACTLGQLLYEWEHLKRKLSARCPDQYERLLLINAPKPHPLFELVEGEREPWEIPHGDSLRR